MNRRSVKRREQTETPNPFRFRGLWRDENRLVIDLRDHHFSRRCLKSNQRVAALEPLTLVYYQPTFEETRVLRGHDFDGVQFNIVKQSRHQTQVLFDVPIPLSPWWRAIWHSPWGTRAILFGLMGVVIVFVANVSGLLISSTAIWCGRLLLVLSLLSMIGGGAFQFSRRWILPVYRVCEGKIWVGGVHRDWLARLPKFEASQTMLREEAWLLHASLWICFWVGVFLLLLFLWGHLVGELSKKDNRYLGYALLTAAAVAILIGNRTRMLLRAARQRLAAMAPPERRGRRR